MKKIYSILFLVVLFNVYDNIYAYDEYSIGQSIFYNHELYYVIENSNSQTNYVTLLKDEPLTVTELYKYGKDENNEIFINKHAPNLVDPEEIIYEYPNNIGGMSYYTSEKCGYDYEWNASSYKMSSFDYSECDNSYNASDVKKVVDNWSKSFKNDLVTVNGYKARIPKFDEMENNLGYKFVVVTGSVKHNEEEIKYDWLFRDSYYYWTMTPFEDSFIYLTTIPYKLQYNNSSLPMYAVRPVINLNKCSIGDEDNNCEKNNQNVENSNNNNVETKTTFVDNNTYDIDYIYNNVNTSYIEYKIGQKVNYNGELYYVVKDSNKNSNYVTLLKDKPLSVDELNKYGKDDLGNFFINKYFLAENDTHVYEYDNGIGGVAYITRLFCGDVAISPDISITPPGEHYEITYCTTDYDASNIRRLINKWAMNFDKDLVKVNGYKAYLLDSSLMSDIIKNDWAKGKGYSYWTSIASNSTNVYAISDDGIQQDLIFNKNAVRPVINLNKCAIDGNPSNCEKIFLNKKCSTKATSYYYQSFKIGDIVTYRDEKYRVIEDSYYDKQYVTLLKDRALSFNDLKEYKNNIMNNIKLNKNVGYIKFICEQDCSDDYRGSNFMTTVDNWAKNNTNVEDLVEVDGYKARILSGKDLLQNLGYSEVNVYGTDELHPTELTPDIFPNVDIWTMYVMKYSNLGVVQDKKVIGKRPYEYYAILPVINLKKEVLDENINYTLGQEITYKDNTYHVISQNSENQEYVTLLKSKPLSQGEISLYNSDGLVISTPYYISGTCDSESNISGCSTNFDTSEVKNIIDIWSNSFTSDLVEVDGYKARVISKQDLIYNLAYDMDNEYNTSYIYCKSSDTPSWVYISNYPSWSMEGYEDSNNKVFQNFPNGCLDIADNPYSLYQTSTIRPVINLNKCALGGCYQTLECNDSSQNNVDVENTLKHISKVLFAVCAILIIVGCTFIGYNYWLSQKEMKR